MHQPNVNIGKVLQTGWVARKNMYKIHYSQLFSLFTYLFSCTCFTLILHNILLIILLLIYHLF